VADLLLPPHLRQARTSFRYVDSTGSSRGLFTGALRTAARGGDRLAATIEFTKHGGQPTDERSSRAVMRSFLASLRGRQNRAYLFDHSYRRRGSFATSELLTNNTFPSGTTGWSAQTNFNPTAADRVLRLTRNAAAAASNALSPTAASTVVQYGAYVARMFTMSGRVGYSAANLSAGGNQYANEFGTGSVFTDYGMQSLGFVPYSTGCYIGLEDQSTSGISGEYFGVAYASLARCALVDGGANLLSQSETFTNASWTKARSSATGGADTGPDGTATASSITEDNTASNTHGVTQAVTVSSAVRDYSITACLKANTRTWAFVQLDDGTHSARVWVNLGTGALGTVLTTGAGMANVRAFLVGLAGGWYAVSLVAQKNSALTTLNAGIFLSTGDATVTYSGDGTSNIRAWRTTLSQSSVPARLVQTTTAATTGTAQIGSALYTKGWPASTNGLLLADDQFEVITSRGSELKILTAPVNSDAAGLAYMQFEPPLRGAPADNAPIIVHQPMGRFGYVGESPGWDNDPGFWSSASCEFEEACSAS